MNHRHPPSQSTMIQSLVRARSLLPWSLRATVRTQLQGLTTGARSRIAAAAAMGAAAMGTVRWMRSHLWLLGTQRRQKAQQYLPRGTQGRWAETLPGVRSDPGRGVSATPDRTLGRLGRQRTAGPVSPHKREEIEATKQGELHRGTQMLQTQRAREASAAVTGQRRLGHERRRHVGTLMMTISLSLLRRRRGVRDSSAVPARSLSGNSAQAAVRGPSPLL